MLSGCRKERRYAVFISGGGSTLQSFLDFQFNMNVRLVVCNRRLSYGALRARRNGVSLEYITSKTDTSELNALLKSYHITHVFLAGYMKILDSNFIENWKDKITNIHPSLLPAFKGLHAAEASWEAKSKMGVTIHNVIAELDAGEILMQKESSQPPESLGLGESLVFLRAAEQRLLREFSMRFSV